MNDLHADRTKVSKIQLSENAKFLFRHTGQQYDPLVAASDELISQNDEWDSFVSTHPSGDIVQTSGWALSKRAIGHSPILITLRGEDGQLVGGMILIVRTVVPFLKFGFVSRGPLILHSSESVFRLAIKELLHVKLKRRIAFLVVQLPEGLENRDGVLKQAGFHQGGIAVAPEATVHVDLTRSEEHILEGFSSGVRKRIRKATTEDVSIVESDDVDLFHQFHICTAQRGEFRPLSLNILKSQWSELSPNRNIQFFLVRNGEDFIGGVCVTNFGGTVTGRVGGWDPSRPAPKGINEFVRWEVMRWAKKNGAVRYDFGGFDRHYAECIANGSTLPAGFEKSHSLFKYGFNSKPTLLPQPHFVLATSLLNKWMAPLAAKIVKSELIARVAQRLRG